jgi:hypothetical protein
VDGSGQAKISKVSLAWQPAWSPARRLPGTWPDWQLWFIDAIFSNQFILKLSSLLANVWYEEAVQTFFLGIRLHIH